MITGQLKSEIDALWDTFANGGITNPLVVIEQITYLLFLRRLDEEQTLKENKANQLGTPIENPIYTPEQRELRWSAFKNLDAELMFELFTKTTQNRPQTAFDFMKTVGGEDGQFAQLLKGATFMIQSARLLSKAVDMIDKIPMKDRDTKGDLYEYLLSHLKNAGRAGQFRTPRHIISMMVEMVKPRPEDTVCDPSVGTAGFLVAAAEQLREKHPEVLHKPQLREHFNTKMFNGIEFDPSMMRIAAMNLMLHGLESPNLRLRDALSQANGDLKDEFSLILANPPFTGSLDYDAVESSLLSTTKTKKTELLFLSLMLRMLRVGGRAAVIVPDGVLFGSTSGHKALRKELVESQQLQAVISIPSGVFKPYATVRTAILFFTKTNSGGTDKVWFYDMQADGYSLDDKRQPIVQNDIPDILARWLKPEEELQRNRTDKSFFVPKDEIEAPDFDLSINRYKEIVYEHVQYDAPKEIINQIKELQQQNIQELQALEAILG